MEDSREYSWAWVTADSLLSHGPCELLYVAMYSNTGGDNAVIYDGENTSGEKVADLITVLGTFCPLAPPVPIYCRRGLYVDIVQAPLGVFVQWRELESKARA